jgi:hypothetical protein
MRKVTFIDLTDATKKLMIYESSDGVYLFGYDCLQDSSSAWDNWYETVEEADDYCKMIYNVDKDDWIAISEPLENCQHDFIVPTKVKGKDQGKPEWGHFLTLINNKWLDNGQIDKCLSFSGMSGNERLFVSGLIFEFDQAKLNNKTIAIKILKALKFDSKSIEQIV